MGTKLQKINKITKHLSNLYDMVQGQLKQKENPNTPVLDAGLETKLLASQLVSEVRKSPGHYSFTLTDLGVIEFAKAMQMAAFEEHASKQDKEVNLFPNSDESFITKKEAMLGFGVSHTTLWKWQKSGYLVPVKVGKRVYYKRSDIENIIK